VTTPLQIKTDSAVGSNEKIDVTVYSTAKEMGLSIKFVNPPQYYIQLCLQTGTLTHFDVDLPGEQNKTWTFTKTATALKIECNGDEVLTYTFSDSSRSACLPHWSKDIVKMKIDGSDTASNEIRAKPGIAHSTHM